MARPSPTTHATRTGSKTPTAEHANKEVSPRPHKWTLTLSIFALFASLASFGNSCYQTIQTGKIYRAHAKPDVRCIVRHSTRPEHRESLLTPELVVWNEGPSKAVAVSVSYRAYFIAPETFEVPISLGTSEDLTGYSIQLEELPLGKPITKVILGGGANTMFVVDSVFYRESDMEKFSKREYFYFDSTAYLSQSDFRTRKEFNIVMRNLQMKLKAEEAFPDQNRNLGPPATSGGMNVNFNVRTLTNNGPYTNQIILTPVQSVTTNQ